MPELNDLIVENTHNIVRLLYSTGHLTRPFGDHGQVPDGIPEPQRNPDGSVVIPDMLLQLKTQEDAVNKALRSYQHFMVNNLEPLIAKHHPERKSVAPRIDGLIGPATLELLLAPRCGHPDYGAATEGEAQGTGQWRGCKGVGNFHGAVIKLMNALPDHVKRPYKNGTVWDEMKRRSKNCYGEVGLRLWYSDDPDVPEGNHQLERTGFNGGQSYIGLAAIGQGQQCQSAPTWFRIDHTFLRSSAIDERYFTLLTNLEVHEMGHSCGSQHTSGGIMNPGILAVPNRWIGDPAESRMKAWFGGVPVHTEPTPPPPPQPPGDLRTFEVVTGGGHWLSNNLLNLVVTVRDK